MKNPKISKLNRAFSLLSALFLCFCLTALPAFADSTAIIQGIDGGAEQLWNIFTSIVVPIGIIALAYCGIRLVIGGTRESEQAKNTMIRILVALAVVLLAPLLIRTASSWFSTTWSGT